MTNSILVFFTIAMSGIPLFTGSEFLSVFYFLALILISLKRKLVLSRKQTLVIILFLVIEIIQHILHGPYSWRTSVGTLIKLSSAYLTVQLISVDFSKIYIRQMVIFSIISFIFYSLQFNSGIRIFIVDNIASFFESQGGLNNSFYERSPSIILYTFDPIAIEQGRNSGPFWEPGAFATFLLIALLFSVLQSKHKSIETNWILVLALISTFSTTGFICLFILYGGIKLLQRGLLSKLSIPVIVVAGIYFFNNTDFLRKKIVHNIAVADQTTSSRFGSALADLELFSDSPWVGWGRGPKRYGSLTVTHLEKENHRNNGLFILLASYGLLGAVIYFVNVYRGLTAVEITRKSKWVFLCFLILLALSFSQDILFKPLLLCIVFFSVVKKSKDQDAHEARHSYTLAQ